jgi:hypothetical protein
VPSPAAEVVEVATPVGPARAHRYAAARPVATLALGHGAGGGIGAPDLVALARALPAAGVEVVLVEQPWRVAGKKVAPATGVLDRAWTAVLARLGPAGLVVVGGRSAGARVACRTATLTGADAVLALAFPLHPPWRPGSSRAEELLGAGVPTLVVQGERDAFGGPGELPPGPSVVRVPWADHSFAVPAGAPLTRREALEVVVDAARGWVLRLAGNRRRLGGR